MKVFMKWLFLGIITLYLFGMGLSLSFNLINFAPTYLSGPGVALIVAGVGGWCYYWFPKFHKEVLDRE